MTHPMAIARLQARNLLADVQTAIASGDWIVSDAADPTREARELDMLLGLPSPAEDIARATDRLAARCGEAIVSGDWLTPANDAAPADRGDASPHGLAA